MLQAKLERMDDATAVDFICSITSDPDGQAQGGLTQVRCCWRAAGGAPRRYSSCARKLRMPYKWPSRRGRPGVCACLAMCVLQQHKCSRAKYLVAHRAAGSVAGVPLRHPACECPRPCAAVILQERLQAVLAGLVQLAAVRTGQAGSQEAVKLAAALTRG